MLSDCNPFCFLDLDSICPPPSETSRERLARLLGGDALGLLSENMAAGLWVSRGMRCSKLLACVWTSVQNQLQSPWWFSCSIVSNSVTPWTVAHHLLCPWDSPGKNTGVGCHFLLQGIFLIQELNPSLLHCRQILYQLSYLGSS